MDAPRAEELFYYLWLPEEVNRKVKTSTLKIHFLLRKYRVLKNAYKNGDGVLNKENLIYNDKWVQQPQSRGRGTGRDGHSKAFVSFLTFFFKCYAIA